MDAAKEAIPEAFVRERSRQLKEPSWLLDDRLMALKRYTSLPAESSPLFTRHVFLPKEVPVDGTPKLDLDAPPAANATLVELSQAPREAAKGILTNDLPAFEHDRLSNLARALFTTGAVLHVPRAAHVEEPFRVPFRIRYEGSGWARNLIVLDEGAHATVLVETAGEAAGTLGLTIEATLGKGAELTLLTVDTTGPKHTTLLTTQARTGEDAVLNLYHAFTGGALIKSRNDVVLQGRGSRVHQGEVVFGSGEQRFDLTSNISHAGPDTTSDALSKAALKDKARANIKGVILLPQSGKGSDSYLQQHAMLLSKEARCIAIPSLEIVNREIKRAKHAATVAQIDEQQLFYLETRGLPEAEARKVIVLGFLGPILQRLPEAHAERIREGIATKWEGRA